MGGAVVEEVGEETGELEVEVVLVLNGVAFGGGGKREVGGVVRVVGDEVAIRLGVLGDVGKEFLVMPAAVFGGHFGVGAVEGFVGGTGDAGFLLVGEGSVGGEGEGVLGAADVVEFGVEFYGFDGAGGEMEGGLTMEGGGAEGGVV